MNYSNDFQKQWKKLRGLLESEMIRACQQNGSIDHGSIDNMLKTEKMRWHVSSEYQYAWLEKMRKNRPDVAVRFDKALETVQVRQPEPSPHPSVIKYGMITLAGAAAGFFAASLLHADMKWLVGSTLGLAVLAGGVSVNLFRTDKEKSHAEDRKAYLEQLEEAGERLLSIVKAADS